MAAVAPDEKAAAPSNEWNWSHPVFDGCEIGGENSLVDAIYHWLWLPIPRQDSAAAAEKYCFHLPHTVLFRGREPKHWYFTSAADRTVKRKRDVNCTAQAIQSAFSHPSPVPLKTQALDIVGQFRKLFSFCFDSPDCCLNAQLCSCAEMRMLCEWSIWMHAILLPCLNRFRKRTGIQTPFNLLVIHQARSASNKFLLRMCLVAFCSNLHCPATITTTSSVWIGPPLFVRWNVAQIGSFCGNGASGTASNAQWVFLLLLCAVHMVFSTGLVALWLRSLSMALSSAATFCP